jgi:phage tail-like protein
MTHLPTLPRKLNPYQNHKFRVVLDGKPVAGFNKMSEVKRVNLRSNLKVGKRLVLEQGLTVDFMFKNWVKDASAKTKLGAKQVVRKNLTIEAFDDAGKLVAAFKVNNCWVSDYTALPELNADGNAVGIASIVLESEGWEPDDSTDVPP